MPVSGPYYNPDEANEAFKEIITILETKYNLKPNNGFVRGAGYDYILNNVLKDLVHQMFKSDAWNGW